MSCGDDLTYGSHLMLDRLLSAQRPVSHVPDEMLFIIQHQTSELWMRLIIEELGAVRAGLLDGRLRPVLKGLGRATVVFEQLVKSWDVLRTLTPADFSRFRDRLGTASGFQSHQYRMIEFMLGNRDDSRLAAHQADPDRQAALRAELERPSVYQAALAHLAERLGRDLGPALQVRAHRHAADPAVTQAWRAVYAEPDAHPELFDLAESLIGLEDQFRCWRFNHVTAVERVIGAKTGTGGTSGVAYLRQVLEVELFPELWQVRTSL